ncbi:hypothetical protein GCM10023185_10520 [Hymenobacter saemangeumensis]|uniref:Outer membrane protein beta-barrel domain-containing protein n=2 Tax=Hymenobacter saemangeumensis TaxID=1084522 RepID=A0ABP8I5I1_9BACT
MNKQLLIFTLLGGASTIAQAQSAISAGTISLGGNIGYSRNTHYSEFNNGYNTYTDETANSEFRFSPSVGYFIADNLAIGLGLGYSAQSSKITRTGPGRNSPDPLDASTTFSVGPYAEYYKMLSDQFGLTGRLGVGYQRTFQPYYSGSSANIVVEAKGNGFYAGFAPGVVFFPIPKFGISASIGGLYYSRVSTTRSNDAEGVSSHSSGFGARFGIDQLMFGGTFFPGR